MTELQELKLEIDALVREKTRLKNKNSAFTITAESPDIRRQRELAIEEIDRQLFILNRKYALERAAFNENQTYLQIRNSVPKIAIYKRVSLHCPKCMGQRIADTSAGKVICPYCDYVEMLQIDHYIDNEKEIQKRLRQEQERQLQQKKIQMQNRAHNDAVVAIFFIAVVGFVFFIGFVAVISTI